jgi:hypothetical protein
MKKMNWFCENWISFKWKYWITFIELNSNTLTGIWIELNFNSTNSSHQLNQDSIELNSKAMDAKLIEKILKICSWYGVEKKTLKRHRFENSSFMPFYLGMD